MNRPCIGWTLLWVGLVGWIGSGCIAGVHHHRIDATVQSEQGVADVDGTVDSIDLGLVADFRVFRLGLPFQGQRRTLDVAFRDGGAFRIDEVLEIRAFQLDVPIWSFKDFSDNPSGKRYPGRMRQRQSLEVWGTASVGWTPVSPVSLTAGAVYYKYGGLAFRVYGGVSWTPYSGIERSIIDGSELSQRRDGRAPGLVGGIEVTLAAGEYALELFRFIRELDRDGRTATDRWN